MAASLQRRGKRVVGGLVAVDVVEWRNGFVLPQRPAENRQGAIGQHFVDVHVRAGAGAALEEVGEDRIGEEPLGHFRTGLQDRLGLGRIAGPDAQFPIHRRAGQLDRAIGPHQFGMDRAARNGKFSIARTVWMPYSASAGTCRSPSASRLGAKIGIHGISKEHVALVAPISRVEHTSSVTLRFRGSISANLVWIKRSPTARVSGEA